MVTLLAEELLASDATDVKIYCLIRPKSDTTQLAAMCKQAIINGIVEVVQVPNLRDVQKILQVIPTDTITYIYHSAAKGKNKTKNWEKYLRSLNK